MRRKELNKEIKQFIKAHPEMDLGWFQDLVNEIVEFYEGNIDKEIIELKKEYANTPLGKRGSGWDWLTKLQTKLKK